MAFSYPELLDEILDLMETLADDWEYGGDLSEETFLFADLGFESLDLVVLGTAIQERFGRMPFAEFLADIGQRTERDVSIGELVSFVCTNQQRVTSRGH